jgi:pimeloyl-ACP methyl ester carboxylesterase
MPLRIACLAILLVTGQSAPATAPASQTGTGAAAQAGTETPAMVIGFTGGFVRRNDMVHGPVQLAERLRRDLPAGTYIGVFDNWHGEQAHAEILRRLDAAHPGRPSPAEKQNARIILYGHSWGATQAIVLARELQRDGVPVLLAVQVDSVAKPGQNDFLIPANVAAAANFYQTTGALHGQSAIRAADPARTQILGNYKFDYAAHPVGCYAPYPWYDRFFMKAHTEIECDPDVWEQVETLIRSRLPERGTFNEDDHGEGSSAR